LLDVGFDDTEAVGDGLGDGREHGEVLGEMVGESRVIGRVHQGTRSFCPPRALRTLRFCSLYVRALGW
jgi:hypothetical protein